jgi:hypothetical protein
VAEECYCERGRRSLKNAIAAPKNANVAEERKWVSCSSAIVAREMLQGHGVACMGQNACVAGKIANVAEERNCGRKNANVAEERIWGRKNVNVAEEHGVAEEC